MGLNTIHSKSKDLATLFNLTKNKTFKAEIIQKDSIRDYEIANGIDFLKIKYVFKINGSSFTELRDKVKFCGKVFQVVSVQPKVDNQEQFRHRSDIDNFTGETVIYLE